MEIEVSLMVAARQVGEISYYWESWGMVKLEYVSVEKTDLGNPKAHRITLFAGLGRDAKVK